MAHLYKSRLQNHAQKKNIAFPVYVCDMQGPPHSRLFKARVTIDGATFEGPDFCGTIKDAEHAAAKVAFMALSPDGSQEDESLYKSLLQEHAQKKGLPLPVYATNRTGQPHMPCFTSTVEISGKFHVGQEARTKKQAEMNAAKVAFMALTNGYFGLQNSEDGLYMATPPGENVETILIQPGGIHPPHPKTTSNVVDEAILNAMREKIRTLACEGSSSNGKRNQVFVKESGGGMSQKTKIVIRPHIPDMTYEGPVQVSDDEWVAMKVNVEDDEI